MKKSLLFAAALCAAFSASAAVEVCFMEAESMSLGDKPVFPEGKVLAESENVKFMWGSEGETSAQNCDFNGFKYLIVDGEMVTLVPGIGGATNPAAVNVFDGPTYGGVQYHIQVNKDGWLIVPSKISSNKNFYAYEGTFAGGMSLLAYTLGMDIQNGDYPDLTYGVYTLPADADGYCDLAAANIEDYTFGGTAIAWPIRIFTKNAEAASAGNGTGALVFPVYKDAVDYWVFATGSKMNTCGAIFVDKDPAGAAPNVTAYCPETSDRAEKAFAITGELQGAGIEDIIANEVADENAPMFNVLGQRVNESYKGLVIKNGQKFINK